MPVLKNLHKIVSLTAVVAFISTSFSMPSLQAGEVAVSPMPAPGTMVNLSQAFTPAHLQGIVIHPDNALQFDFLIHKGDGNLTEVQKKEEYTKLIKYFLASLTVPDENQWVNLSPYEKNRIIKDDFGTTEMGRDLLAQDYLLKQITSSLMYPESGLGKSFWDKVYERAHQELGNTNIPVNTFNKVWIIPDEATIYESGNTAYIVKHHLKVMLEEDYLSLEKHTAIAKEPNKNHAVTSRVIKEIILPAIEKEVNEGKNFAQLRQVASSMILATWYKKALKESLLGKVYADKAKTQGVNQDPKNNEAIYQQYLQAFKKGVYNYIKEDADKYTNQTVPRKYFAGGVSRRPDMATLSEVSKSVLDNVMAPDSAMVDSAMTDLLASRKTVEFRIPEIFVPLIRPNEIDLEESTVELPLKKTDEDGPGNVLVDINGFEGILKRMEEALAVKDLHSDEITRGSDKPKPHFYIKGIHYEHYIYGGPVKKRRISNDDANDDDRELLRRATIEFVRSRTDIDPSINFDYHFYGVRTRQGHGYRDGYVLPSRNGEVLGPKEIREIVEKLKAAVVGLKEDVKHLTRAFGLDDFSLRIKRLREPTGNEELDAANTIIADALREKEYSGRISVPTKERLLAKVQKLEALALSLKRKRREDLVVLHGDYSRKASHLRLLAKDAAMMRVPDTELGMARNLTPAIDAVRTDMNTAMQVPPAGSNVNPDYGREFDSLMGDAVERLRKFPGVYSSHGVDAINSLKVDSIALLDEGPQGGKIYLVETSKDRYLLFTDVKLKVIDVAIDERPGNSFNIDDIDPSKRLGSKFGFLSPRLRDLFVEKIRPTLEIISKGEFAVVDRTSEYGSRVFSRQQKAQVFLPIINPYYDVSKLRQHFTSNSLLRHYVRRLGPRVILAVNSVARLIPVDQIDGLAGGASFGGHTMYVIHTLSTMDSFPLHHISTMTHEFAHESFRKISSDARMELSRYFEQTRSTLANTIRIAGPYAGLRNEDVADEAIAQIVGRITQKSSVIRIQDSQRTTYESPIKVSDIDMLIKHGFLPEDFKPSTEERARFQQSQGNIDSLYLGRVYPDKAMMGTVKEALNIQAIKGASGPKSSNPQQIDDTMASEIATTSADSAMTKGGIDMNAANMAMTIKRDGKGVPLPLAQQDMAQMSRIGGFIPMIREIRPITAMPLFSELRQKPIVQPSLASAS